ncbi:MAG: MBL fold metallo-hydrolase [Acetobacteraceae bacterium]|nr:MBL fold metallo-hydrolase [Acetobacteraceae bacterium]
MAVQGVIVPVTPFAQNCTLLWEERERRATVIDPGGDIPAIRAALDEAGVSAERILLTHGHIDHAGGAAELAAALGVEVWGPDARDDFLLAGLEQQGRQFGIAGARAVTPDRWLAEGDTVSIAGERFTVLHCPGHTPGHVVFVSTAARLAVIGDVLFRGSIGRTDFPYGDHEALLSVDPREAVSA